MTNEAGATFVPDLPPDDEEKGDKEKKDNEEEGGAIRPEYSRQDGCNLAHRGVSKLTPRINFETTLLSIQKEGKLETAVSLALKPLRFQNESKESTLWSQCGFNMNPTSQLQVQSRRLKKRPDGATCVFLTTLTVTSVHLSRCLAVAA